MNEIPGVKITQGEPYAGSFTLQGQDWTGFTGTGTIKRRRSDKEPILTFTPTGDAAGLVSYAMTEDETALLPSLPRAGFFATCIAQIRMTDGTDVFSFQFPVGVFAQL